MRHAMKRFGLAVAVLGLVIGAAERVSAGIVVVSPSNPNGWNPVVTDSSGSPGGNPTGSVSFVTGPATPPLGVGSANLTTGDGTNGGDGSAQLRYAGYAGVRLDSLTALSYSTYVTSNNGQQFPYLNLTVSFNGPGPQDDKLYFEPPYQQHSTGNPSLPDQGPTQLNTWQTWNVLEGGFWTDSGLGTPGTGVISLSTYLAAHPNATLENAPSGLGGLRLNVGFASPNDKFNGYVDALTVGISGENTTYNFEPDTAAAAPEPSTLAGAGMAVLMGLGYAWRRRKRAA